MKTAISLSDLDKMQSDCEADLRTIKEFRKLLIAKNGHSVILGPSKLSKQKQDNGKSQTTAKKTTAVQKIRDAIYYTFSGASFTIDDVMSKLPSMKRGRVGMTIYQLKAKGLIAKVGGGNGNILARYKRTNKDGWADLVTDKKGG